MSVGTWSAFKCPILLVGSIRRSRNSDGRVSDFPSVSRAKSSDKKAASELSRDMNFIPLLIIYYLAMSSSFNGNAFNWSVV